MKGLLKSTALGAFVIALISGCAGPEQGPASSLNTTLASNQCRGHLGISSSDQRDYAEYGIRAVNRANIPFGQFQPSPTNRGVSIDYSIIDEGLEVFVFESGPSLRTRATPRNTSTGERIIRGHRSSLRLEGNKVLFSKFDRETIEAITSWRESLEQIGNTLDITTLDRNEQLAYWLNLHNILVVEQIALNYPVREPSKLRINGQPLHTAPLTTIADTPLSLSDIRMNIVYHYWDIPDVIYGFYRGDLGGPQLAASTYKGLTVRSQLRRQGQEFANALRGVDATQDALMVSPVYLETACQFFQNWPSDLTTHLTTLALDDVQALLKSDVADTVQFAAYEGVTGDFVGGQPMSDLRNVAGAATAQPQQFDQINAEFEQKFIELRKADVFSGRVVIRELGSGEVLTLDELDERRQEENGQTDDN